MTLVLEKHISQSANVRGGKARLSDTRITVSDVVSWHFHRGLSLDEIAAKYDLPLGAVYAAIAYYYDHQVEIDREIDASLAAYYQQKQETPSLLREKLSKPDSE